MSLGMMAGMMVPCTRLVADTGAGGLKGQPRTYADGAPFRALLIKTAAPETHVAEREDSREQYTVVVPLGVALAFDEVFKRDADGATFRCTSSTRDQEAPDISTVPIARCTAERWDIP